MGEEIIRLSASQTLRVISSGPDALELESTWTTSPKPPPVHWHPHQVELFEVLEGQLTVEMASTPVHLLKQGNIVDIPARTPHRMWNAGPDVARATWRITPPQRSEEMFRFIERGTRGLRGLRLLWTFRDEYRFGGAMGGP